MHDDEDDDLRLNLVLLPLLLLGPKLSLRVIIESRKRSLLQATIEHSDIVLVVDDEAAIAVFDSFECIIAAWICGCEQTHA